MAMTDEEVEQSARDAWAYANRPGLPFRCLNDWDSLTETAREGWRMRARAAAMADAPIDGPASPTITELQEQLRVREQEIAALHAAHGERLAGLDEKLAAVRAARDRLEDDASKRHRKLLDEIDGRRSQLALALGKPDLCWADLVTEAERLVAADREAKPLIERLREVLEERTSDLDELAAGLSNAVGFDPTFETSEMLAEVERLREVASGTRYDGGQMSFILEHKVAMLTNERDAARLATKVLLKAIRSLGDGEFAADGGVQ